MARITVEDCLEKVPNRFKLVMIASKRARQLALTGAEAFVDWENDKPTVVALREIAGGYIGLDDSHAKEEQTEQPVDQVSSDSSVVKDEGSEEAA